MEKVAQQFKTDEEAAQWLLDTFGYISLSCFAEHKMREVLTQVDGKHGEFTHPVVVIGLSTEAEHRAQCEAMGSEVPAHDLVGRHFYRVTAE